jgi:hypothetical protein
MIQLRCVACGSVESIQNQADEKRSRTCHKCGQPLIELRAPGSSPQAQPLA